MMIIIPKGAEAINLTITKVEVKSTDPDRFIKELIKTIKVKETK